MKLAFDKAAGESDALYQLQRSVPKRDKRDRFTPINASPEYKEAFRKREDVRPLRTELREAREIGADEKKLDRIRAKIHYRLTQLASSIKRPTECDLRAWRPQHFRLHIDCTCLHMHMHMHLPWHPASASEMTAHSGRSAAAHASFSLRHCHAHKQRPATLAAVLWRRKHLGASRGPKGR